jgi:hypothetical protein
LCGVVVGGRDLALYGEERDAELDDLEQVDVTSHCLVVI